MKYLNLTKGFNPFNSNPDNTVKFESFFFNGGEPHIKLHMASMPLRDNITITSRLNNMNDFGMLLVATEAIKQSNKCENLELFIPYFPGARQDRRMIAGEPLTVKVYSDIINSCCYDMVTVFDPHSDVTPALINNCEVIDNHDFVKRVLLRIMDKTMIDPIGQQYLNWNKPIIISPDAGSNKKCNSLIKFLNFTQIRPVEEQSKLYSLIKCDKTRDVTNGNITGFEVYSNDLQGKDCIIVDDICDGGGTFIGLAKELKKKNASDIYLIVSHGIFSKPLKELKPYFKKIYTTDSWRSEFDWEQKERDCTDLVEIIPFNKFL